MMAFCMFFASILKVLLVMKPRICSAEEALKVLQSNQRVYIHSVAMAPQALIKAMVGRHADLRNVEVVHMHTEGPAPYAEPQYAESFRHNACFVGANVRQAIKENRADYIPVFLSEVPLLFRRGKLPIDVALISVSPPDEHGYCSLGSSVDATLAAEESAKIVIAQVNRHVPRSHGDGLIHVSHINYLVEADEPLLEVAAHTPTEIDRKIGRHIAGLVEDGATLQLGIGAIPDAVLSELIHHKDIGVHTEMFSDGLIDLVEKGVINNKMKKVLPHRIVTSFVMGTKRLYDFIDDNPGIAFKDCAYTNDTAVIRRNPKVTAINSAIEVDLMGQVCADTIGSRQYSGVGGQMDFIRGASLSEGGKPIIALPSVTRNGKSKIVPLLKEGAGVTTTRANVHYLVTEYGVADVYGKNLRQRARLLTDIAHPDHREWLEKEAFKLFG